MKVVTIGIYGFTAEGFFSALRDSGVDVFCDIRWRRGVRGADYAFANHKRLLASLAALGINYIHRRDLAPTPEIRKLQKVIDKNERVAKRKRNNLSPQFMGAYQQEVLQHFDPRTFLDGQEKGTKVVALCCVERLPDACHRSLVAEVIKEQVGVEVEHLVPD